MPVVRYRGVEDMPSALQGDDGMTPAEGLRLACELSDTALRLAGHQPAQRGVRRHTRLTTIDDDQSVDRSATTDG
ncbi:MAG: hypothetical protein KY460_08205 [Actinobacteria bacterium]|nr:hypothetical protein [Actinomycetota bacterium]